MMDIAAKPYSTWAVANFRVTNSQRSAVDSIPHRLAYEQYSP